MATPEIIEMAPSGGRGGGNETWIRKNWTLVLFVVILLGAIAGLIYLTYVVFVKSDCTCGTGDGKVDCDKCKPKQGMPADTSCQSDANKCRGGQALGSFLQWLSKTFEWLAKNMWVTAVAGLVLLLAAAAGLFVKLRGGNKGDTMPTLSEATNEIEMNKERAKAVDADYKEYEEFLDEKIKEAKSSNNAADAAKYEKAQKTFSDSKAKLKSAMEDINASRFFENGKKALKANEKFVSQMVKAEEALAKVKKTVGEAPESKAPAEDTANKANEEAEIAEEEAHRLAREISNSRAFGAPEDS